MTDKQRLNALLRLRLFFSTEEEMERFVDFKLRNNRFNKFKEVQSRAYFCMFAEMCREDTQGDVELASLLDAYEAASVFYMREVAGRNLLHQAGALQMLLCGVCLGVEQMPNEAAAKLRTLVEKIREDGIDVGLFLLLALGVIPKFYNRQTGDIENLAGDWEKAYSFLLSLCHSLGGAAFTRRMEVGVVREMRMHLDYFYHKKVDLSRLLLIAYTQKAVEQIFSLRMPEELLHNVRKLNYMDFELSQWYQASGKESGEEEAWMFEPLNYQGIFNLYHYVFNHTAHKAHFTRSQVTFQDVGEEDVCYSFFQSPSYFWHSCQQKEFPSDAYALVFTDVVKGKGSVVDELHFEQPYPLSAQPLTLRRVKSEKKRDSFSSYLHNFYELIQRL